MLEAMGSPYNFFFDLTEDQTVVRAPFSDIDALLQLPPTQFGKVSEWRSYMGMSRYDESEESPPMDGALDCYVHQQSDDENEDMIVDEVGHLPSYTKLF